MVSRRIRSDFLPRRRDGEVAGERGRWAFFNSLLQYYIYEWVASIKKFGPCFISMARKASILRPASRDYGGQVVQSDISSPIQRGGLWRDPFESSLKMKADTFHPFLSPSSFILEASFWQKSFFKKRIFTPGDKREKTIAFLLKERGRYSGKTCLL